MFRRTFLLLGAMLVGLPRRAWTRLSRADPGFQPLTTPVRVPLGQLSADWQPVAFKAEAMQAGDSHAAARRVIISGVVFRAGGAAPDLRALCVTCPHEQCEVQLVTDPARLARMAGGASGYPLFECGCHFSVFDASDNGARLAGPAPRGLFRFTAHTVGDQVEIDAIEREALSFV
jgi:Rieske Fe-S protein